MNKEKQKINGIINEIMFLLLEKGAKDICVKVEGNEKQTQIRIISNKISLDNGIIKKLNKTLNTEEAVEVEGYYWELIGKSGVHDNLYLIGSMVDKVEVNNGKDGKTEIVLYRKKQLQ